MTLVGKSEKTYAYYRDSDEEFRNEIKAIRAQLSAGGPRKEVPPFEEFARDYLGHEMFAHQLQWIDVLEGRRPRGMHSSMTYEEGEPDLIMCNTPPEHAKTTTITVDYVAWRIC